MAISGFLARTALGLALTVTVPLTAYPAVAKPPPPPTPPAPPPVASSRWGIIGRNTIGEPNAFLRGGPWARSSPTNPSADVPPPYGNGSLGIIVGTGAEKIEYGNETDFANLPIRNLNTLKYWIYAGTDSLSGISLPIISIEANPKVGAITYTSLSYMPESSTSPSAPAVRVPNVWQQYDATAAGNRWYATGSAGTAIGCTQATPCSFADLKSRIPNAVVSLSLGISKGRDTPFIGAVDGLQVNNVVYDFEQNGVRQRPSRLLTAIQKWW